MVSRLNLLLENIIPFLFCSILSCHCLVATDVQDAENCHKETPSRRNHGRKFHLTVGGDNKYKIYHEQFLKGTQIIQSNCTYRDMSPQ